MGLRYERRLSRQLETLCRERDLKFEHGPWFAYKDKTREGTCCIDFIIHSNPILIIETKLTYRDAAIAELRDLYLPVAVAVLGRDSTGLVICRALTPDVGLTISCLSDAIETHDNIPTLLWLGQTRIVW